MAWYLRTINGGTDGVAYETRDLALEQVRYLIHRELGLRHRVVNDGGRVSFYDGPELIDTVRIEDEEGNDVPIPEEIVDQRRRDFPPVA